MGMMQPLYVGHEPLTDIELFELFNVEIQDENGLRIDDLWHLLPMWGEATFIDNFDVSAKIEDISREQRIALYAERAANGLPIFDEDEDEL